MLIFFTHDVLLAKGATAATIKKFLDLGFDASQTRALNVRIWSKPVSLELSNCFPICPRKRTQQRRSWTSHKAVRESFGESRSLRRSISSPAADASPQEPQREEWTGPYPRYGLHPRAA